MGLSSRLSLRFGKLCFLRDQLVHVFLDLFELIQNRDNSKITISLSLSVSLVCLLFVF